MDVKKFLKDYWHIVTTIIAVIFIGSSYYIKIGNMENEISNNSKEITTLTKTVYILVGVMQKDYPNLNITSYLQASKQNNIPIETTVKGLSILKNSTPQVGKSYLMQYQGFNKEQASAVYKNSND